MRICFLVERPTQFEVPFYRHVANDSASSLRVIYTGGDPAAPIYDSELSRPVSWGFDLLGGYEAAVAPLESSRALACFLANELRPGSFDLVITNGYTQRAYLRAAWTARRNGLKTGLRLDSVAWSGVQEHGGVRAAAKRFVFRRVLPRGFDLFLGVGSLTLDYLRAHGVAEDRLALFPYAIDVATFRERSRIARVETAARIERRVALGIPRESAPNARVILALAKFGERESPRDLLRAFAAPQGELTANAWLILAGDGPERGALEAEARALGVAERVKFPGYVPYAELPALYAAADLFVHPAAEERWGVSVEEALACDLPVVASSRVGAAYDLVREGENGGMFGVGDVADLAQAMERALALDPASVARTNERVLARWDYAATWAGLLAAARGKRSAPPPVLPPRRGGGTHAGREEARPEADFDGSSSSPRKAWGRTEEGG